MNAKVKQQVTIDQVKALAYSKVDLDLSAELDNYKRTTILFLISHGSRTTAQPVSISAVKIFKYAKPRLRQDYKLQLIH